MRRQAVKWAPSTPKYTGIYTSLHAHRCTDCGQRYADVCSDSRINGECVFCTSDLGWALLRENRLPKDCCRAHGRPTTREDDKRYQLCPANDWWICTACGRTHPYHPGTTP